MKMLCLLLAVANITLLLWEYRHGAFGNPEPVARGYQAILLVGEPKKTPDRAGDSH
jgi:hypothetical protein